MKYQSHIGKKMVTYTFNLNSKSAKTVNNNHEYLQKSSKIVKPSLHNVISTGTNFKCGFPCTLLAV